MSFYSTRPIKAVRKARYCYWCGEMIEAGQPAVSSAGFGEDFWSTTMHPECEDACCKWWDKHRGNVDEGPEEHSMKRGSTEEKWP